MDVATFHALRQYAGTPSGNIAYIEQGRGPVALFIHGVPLNGYHWRHVIRQVQATHRCIALDLMGLGYTAIGPRHDVSFDAQARMVREFLDALGIEQVDLIANDSGGAIAQIFAAHHPHRLRTLTLTNCDVHTNWPPTEIAQALQGARDGTLIDAYAGMIDDAQTRYARWTRTYADSRVLTDEIYRLYMEPLRVNAMRRDNFHRYWLAFDHAQTVAIEPLLRQLHVPTLIVWALDDIFFDVQWAYWLKDTIPGATRVVEVPGARLFFPEDQPEALLDPLLTFLSAHANASPRSSDPGG